MTKTLALLFLLLSAPLAAAADWPIACEGTTCTASLGLKDDASGKMMATVLVARTKGEAEARIGAALPLGVALAPGARFVAGAETVDLTFDVCFPDGCRAMAGATPERIAALAAAGAFELRFFPYGRDRAVAVRVPADGLAETLDALRRQADARP